MIRETLTGNTPEAEQAAQAIAAAAESIDLPMPPIAYVGLAVAALSSFDRWIEESETVSSGTWDNEDSRANVRRRLRDRAAVKALDEGYTITARPDEIVVGLGVNSEAVEVDVARSVEVRHRYPARFLLPAGVVGHVQD